MLTANEGSIRVVTVHPEGDMNICTTFHGSPSRICLDISVWTTDGAGPGATGVANHFNEGSDVLGVL